MTTDLYIVIKAAKNWWKKPRVDRAVKRQPVLAPNEVAVKIQIDIPDNFLESIIVPVKIQKENLIRPAPTIKVP